MESDRALKTFRVNVPDAQTRASLAVIRSLGRQGCFVAAGRPPGGAIGAASRHAARSYDHPDAALDPRGFARAVGAAARELGTPNVLPAADVPAYALLEHRGELPPGTRLMVPPEEALASAHDKIRLVELAAALEVPVPRGFAVDGEGEVELERDPRLSALGFPLVLKPAVSRWFDGVRWRGASVRVVPDRAALERTLQDVPEFGPARRFLVQEKVPGEGRGVFVLAHEGEAQCVFAHRRVREKPPWGGVSTLCEVAVPEPRLVEHAVRLVRALGWSGVAMVEFKHDVASGRSWLMEINGRFWGSMQLAIAAGVDFPWLLVQQALGGVRPGPVTADPRVRLLWILGDLDQFVIRLRTRGLRELPRIAGDLLWRTRAGHRMSFDTLSLRDPRPFFFELRAWLAALGGAR